MARKTVLNQDLEENNEKENSSRINRKRKTIQKIYNLTNYRSYHAFKKANTRLNIFLGILAIIGFISCFMAGQFGVILRGLILVLLITYMFSYSWIMTKSRQLRRDSTYALQEMEFESGAYVSSWQLYDGIYDDDNCISLEITFGRESSFIVDIIKLIRKKGKFFPLPQNDIRNLQTMIFNLSNITDQNWVVYSTLTDELANKLVKDGFDLRVMSNKYRTKPNRLDYAVATGDWKKAFFKYPRSFTPYVIFVDREKYQDQLKHEEIEKVERKENILKKNK